MKDLLPIAIIQTSLVWENKAANLSMLATKAAAVKGAAIIVLPEMFNTGFSMQPDLFAEDMKGETVQWMMALAQQKKAIITGSIIIRDEQGFKNRMLWVQPDGTIHHYDKRHLFGYAGEQDHYTGGDRRVVVQVNGWRILLQVCYDLRFPVWARQQPQDDGKPEYDVIIYTANWPERRSMAWKTLLQARAIENQAYVVGVNRVGEDGNEIYHSGDSSVFDPVGSMIYQVAHREDVHTVYLQAAELQDMRTKLPFLKDADQFTLML